MDQLTLLQWAREHLAYHALTTFTTRELSAALSAKHGGDPSKIAQGLARLAKQGCTLVVHKERFIQARGPLKGKEAHHYFWRYTTQEWSPPSTTRPAGVANLPQGLADEISRLANRLQEHELRLAAAERVIALAEKEERSAGLDDAAVATLQRIADIMRTQGWEI